MDDATIGPLDADTIRPVKTLVTVKLIAMLVVLAFAIGSAALLAPQIGAALGFARTVSATVTEVVPFEHADPAAEAAAESSTCIREQVHVAWGDVQTGTFVSCAGGHSGSDMTVAPGDIVEVRALPGWETVVVGDSWPNVLVTLLIVAAAVGAILASLRYRRESAALTAVGRGAINSAPLAATRTGLALAFDPVSLGKGKRATAEVTFDAAPYRPLRLQVPGTTTQAMTWRSAVVRPLRTARSGRPAGPYALQLASGGVIIAAGRPLKAAR